MNADLPFSAAAERNKLPIGDALEDYFRAATTVLEIASGTGQHALYLTERFTHLVWQCSEQPSHIKSLIDGLSQSSSLELAHPVALEVGQAANDSELLTILTSTPYSFVYSANTAHIMSIEEVAAMFQLVGQVMDDGGNFALYGPFKVNGEHTSTGNREFDISLRAQNPHMGIRELERMQKLAGECDLVLENDIAMPANNRILIWARS